MAVVLTKLLLNSLFDSRAFTTLCLLFLHLYEDILGKNGARGMSSVMIHRFLHLILIWVFPPFCLSSLHLASCVVSSSKGSSRAISCPPAYSGSLYMCNVRSILLSVFTCIFLPFNKILATPRILRVDASSVLRQSVIFIACLFFNWRSLCDVQTASMISHAVDALEHPFKENDLVNLLRPVSFAHSRMHWQHSFRP